MIKNNILNSVASRFLMCLQSDEINSAERLFFILEEAHWFIIDVYNITSISFVEFSKQLLAHVGIETNVDESLKAFIKYRQSVKVFGAILLDPSMTHVLVVKEKKKLKNYSFPKGKKCMNENGIDCATREVYEEIGYDAGSKICNLPIFIFEKITFYFVFNVKTSYPFKTQTKKEIDEIRWIPIKTIMQGECKKRYSIVNTALKKAKNLIFTLKKSRFRLNVKKIMQSIDKKMESYI
ncbi:mRNA decapping enzyme 2 [Ordospora colligata]|uniref:mRNA decapping enzyme 2 n=1 Tax=Ordospora colligata OC4 TaxID=1354746 RepID=A0A0B2UK95_9MICR|nr:mRNA decapping enzyme 2 [Ordospora colligata OC4]KHN69420.1 mRNA decapping enzyme 2 [Ordospora colligata OC4]TBU14934.1 mRNA decapping enzyme 2 [Ordospora colligata]TBU15065.1 mRNA decapping enzyme 2 [Ordospora colligata]TBU18319.1 mRNA decapping enzyme 2 [Ordospora colligata]